MNDTNNFDYDKTLCRSCKWRAWVNNTILICYYIGFNGEPRGCPIDMDCIRYEQGNPPKY